MHRLLAHFQKMLSSRWIVVAATLAAILVTSPAVTRGFKIDDFIHRDFQLASGARSGLLETLHGFFAFVTPETLHSSHETGAVPWWTTEELRISFFRPLSSFTHWLDYRLWPNSSSWMHLQSIAWYGLACAVIAALYRRLLGPTWVAGLAALFFAVDDAHAVPVEWIANRNVLISLVFAGLTIFLHDRWRRDRWRVGGVLAPSLFALSLLSAEAGIAAAAYVVAHAVCLETGTWQRRLRALVPYFAVAVGWRLLYHVLGFGASGSDLYVDPGREPLRFAAAVAQRGPLLLLGQFGWPDPVLYNLLAPTAATRFYLASLAFMVIAVLVFLPLLRRNRVARFWVLGSVLSVIPTCAMGIPSGRQLVFCGVGAMPLVVLFAAALARGENHSSGRVAWRLPAWIFAVALFALHGLWSPYKMVATLTGPDTYQQSVERLNDFGPPPGAEDWRIVVINPPCVFYLVYYRSLRSFRGLGQPARLHTLAPGHRAVNLTRIDERSLEVWPEGGFALPGSDPEAEAPSVHPVYLYAALDRTFRGAVFPMETGQRFDRPGFSAVVSTWDRDSQSLKATFYFDLALEDPSLVWIQWNWETRSYEPFHVPPIGESTRVPGPFAKGE